LQVVVLVGFLFLRGLLNQCFFYLLTFLNYFLFFLSTLNPQRVLFFAALGKK